ncbi:hypothetical protein KJ966_26520 [bacterium]|nr:hypothetical protein [bacterium]
MFSLPTKNDPSIQYNLVSEVLVKIEERLNKTPGSDLVVADAIKWIETVLKNAIELSNDENLEKDPPVAIALPKEIAAYAIQKMVHLLTLQNDLRDNGLYYLGDAAMALNIDSKEMRNLLDSEFDKLRLQFTVQLKTELDSEQLYWCALMLMKIICADGHIHPSEKLYFDIISELIKNSNTTLDQLKKTALEASEIPKLELNTNAADAMLKYVVTIAMCDGEYAGQESEFIKKAAVSLGIEESNIDAILQPVASSFMVLESLFPKAL